MGHLLQLVGRRQERNTLKRFCEFEASFKLQPSSPPKDPVLLTTFVPVSHSPTPFSPPSYLDLYVPFSPRAPLPHLLHLPLMFAR